MVYTIGYDRLNFNDFKEFVEANNITIIDVRSAPGSGGCFHGNNLKTVFGDKYHQAGNYLGGRIRKKEFYTDGTVDFQKYWKSDEFKLGIRSILTYEKKGDIILICKESDPLKCHRTFMVSPILSFAGLEVIHINNKFDQVSNNDLFKMLMQKYNLSITQIIEKFNKVIGYKK